MEPSPPRRRSKLLILILLAAAAIPAAWGLWNRNQTNAKLAVLHAEETQGKLAPAGGATVIRVWGAGARTGSGFCGCAMVPRPERVLFETKDPAEIAGLVSRIQPRAYLTLDPQCKCCSNITVDFLQGETLLLSIHLKGLDLPSTRGTIPISAGSRERIEEWLALHKVRETLDAAFLPGTAPKPH